jgi:hypothetical protein
MAGDMYRRDSLANKERSQSFWLFIKIASSFLFGIRKGYRTFLFRNSFLNLMDVSWDPYNEEEFMDFCAFVAEGYMKLIKEDKR